MSKFINNWKPEVRSLLRSLVAEGCTIVSGSNGEDDFNFHPGNRAKFVNELVACDEAILYVRTPGNDRLASVSLVFGNDPGELPSDYTVRPEIEAACTAHYKKWDGRPQPKAPCPHYVADLKRHNIAAAVLNQHVAFGTLHDKVRYGYAGDRPGRMPDTRGRFYVTEGRSCGQETPLLWYGAIGEPVQTEVLLHWVTDLDGVQMFPR